MSEEQLKAFLEKVKADTSLQEKLKAAGDAVAVAVAVAAIAKDAGFCISADELKEQNAQEEMTDEELEGVAGGTGFCSIFTYRCNEAASWHC